MVDHRSMLVHLVNHRSMLVHLVDHRSMLVHLVDHRSMLVHLYNRYNDHRSWKYDRFPSLKATIISTQPWPSQVDLFRIGLTSNSKTCSRTVFMTSFYSGKLIHVTYGTLWKLARSLNMRLHHLPAVYSWVLCVQV